MLGTWSDSHGGRCDSWFPSQRTTQHSFRSSNWATPETLLADGNLYWRQYAVLIDLYKYYLDIAWKASVWYYALTGALLTYFFAELREGAAAPYLPWLLTFLAALSAALSFLYVRAVLELMQLKDWVEHIAVRLQLPGRPHVEFGAFFMLFNAAMLCIISIMAVVLFAVFVH
jgi:hypothetical protein